MKTLIIDNNSKHIEELKSLFKEAEIINKKNLNNDLKLNKYDLLVLSGGSNVPTVLRHPNEYSFEMNLIRTSNIPIIGICLGLEIITKAFDGELQELPVKHKGLVQLKISDPKLKSSINSEFIDVIEVHHINIKKLPEKFISCANSQHGVEIIKHINKPIIGFQFHPEILKNQKLIDWMFKTLNLEL